MVVFLSLRVSFLPLKYPHSLRLSSRHRRLAHYFFSGQVNLHDIGFSARERGSVTDALTCVDLLPHSFRRLARNHNASELSCRLRDPVYWAAWPDRRLGRDPACVRKCVSTQRTGFELPAGGTGISRVGTRIQ
jgi:hypothetical protein